MCILFIKLCSPSSRWLCCGCTWWTVLRGTGGRPRSRKRTGFSSLHCCAWEKYLYPLLEIMYISDYKHSTLKEWDNFLFCMMMQSFWQMIVVIPITHIWTGCDWTYPCSHECLVHKNTNLTDDQQPVSCTWSLRRNMCEGSSRRPTCKRDHVPLETVNLEVNFPNMYISKKSQKNLVLQKIYIKKIFFVFLPCSSFFHCQTWESRTKF